MSLYTSPDGQAQVFETVDGGFIVHVSADVYWGYIGLNVRGDFEAAKKKADLEGTKRARKIAKKG